MEQLELTVRCGVTAHSMSQLGHSLPEQTTQYTHGLPQCPESGRICRKGPFAVDGCRPGKPVGNIGFWVEHDSTAEQRHQEIDRRLADGRAAPNDKFHFIGWQA
jgi:hypothetical protein